MYNELYAAWRKETEEASLGHLPPEFYNRIADYLRQVNEENKILEKKSLKVNLLEHEAQNVKRMLEELLRLRFKKLVKTIIQNQKLPSDLLTVEEEKMSDSLLTFTEAYKKFAKNLMQGQAVKLDVKVEAPAIHKRVTIRFLKSIPNIVGSDMKTYGPFVSEDIASLPVENAKMLIKQGLAVLVEVS